MRVGVIGLGHVGLPTAAALARLGHDVTAGDRDTARVEQLTQGVMPFFEPGLEDLVADEVHAGRLRVTAEAKDVVGSSAVVFICVGTPPRASGEADLRAVEQAAEVIATYASGPIVVVEKSTVPAGTAERLSATLARYRRDVSFQVVSNPEFMREGYAVEDSLRPARILVGSDAEEARALMAELYRPLVDAGARFIETDLTTAELAKHACNAFLALKISFVNALARLCERADADVWSVADVMGADPRIGRAFLDAGLGYGGYCFPKDLAAFDRLSERLGYPFPLLKEVARINDEAVDATLSLIQDSLWNLEGKRIALLGLSFKPGTDDVRFSPALALGAKLAEAGAEVVGYDPEAGENARAELAALKVAEDPYDALRGAHAAVVCTEWAELSALDLERAREAMAFPILVDGRHAIDAKGALEAGFTYLALGRPRAPLAHRR
ncbi:MAG: UDP-glucose/GDP-mannose dehydrogenase family protein [Acidimicrobiales bacterium]|nr:UDP-glucose/GDP-mannose dehydrogenase family protein [Acidimicrobiales bacterium]